MIFSVGDEVRIREDLEIGGHYGSFVIVPDMKQYFGTIQKIRYVGDDYYRFEGVSYYWTDKMLDLEYVVYQDFALASDEDFLDLLK